MSEIDLNVDVGQTKTLTFNTKDKYNSEDIVFNITGESEVPYLPLAGGTMSGNLNMGGKLITNGNMYETSLLWGHGHYSEKRIIDTLLTQPGNRFACTPASHIDVEYSRDNGETWLDYGLSDTQKMNIFTLDDNYVFLGKRIDDGVNGVVDVAKDRIRITWWSLRNSIVSFYGNLHKFLIKTVVQPTGQVINTKISKLSIGDYNNNTDNWITLDSVVHAGQPIERSYNYASDIHTSNGTLGSAFWENLTIALRFEFSYDSTSTEQTHTLGARLYYIKGFGNKIYQHAVGYSGVPFNNQPFTYDSYQNTTFPAKVTSQEPINYDAVIKPTQSGNTVTKTNNWVLQYLTQGVNWLRDNKVETNSDATLRTLNIKGGVNSTAMLTSTASNEFFIQLGGTIPFLLYPTVVRPGMSYTNTVDLGNTESYWKSVRAGKYIVHGGTSSQFLKADGSVDSNSYATLDSTGKVPTSQLPSYVDDVAEYTNRASFPATGEKGKIYVDVKENDIYRWTGSTYIKISGIIGAQGEKGAQGFQGKSGVDGVQGYQGIKGTDGTNGVQGYQGLQGIKGTDGSRGLQGFQGIKGTDGTNGTQGYQGYTGAQGYQGIKGEDGTSVKILGTKDSTSQLPLSGNANGDGYIIGDNLYVWDGSTWTNVGTIKGPQGAQGYQGIKGTDGSRGVQGYQGIKGTDGTNGTNGVQGYRGYQGYTGLQGTTGLQGKNGTNGTNGVQGYTGLQGKQGLQGIKGTDGTNGTNGTNGAQGYQGYTGEVGKRGVQGYTGLQGVTGLQGIKGTNFAGCFRSQYSLHNANQSTIGIDYTFNKSGFEFFNAVISPGDTILVTYLYENNNVTYEDHFYIKIKQFSSDNTTFIGTVQNHFTINGIQGVQGATGIQGKNGADGAQGYRGYQGYTGIQGKQGLQGISGALATNHWYLDKANPEVTGTNGGSKLIQLDLSTDSIFAKLSNLTNGPLNGRSFIVNWTDSNGNGIINDLFGDFSEYAVPNQVRYHFYIQNMSKRESPVKIKWNPEFYTNVSHRPGFTPDIGLNYSECCKIEFVKFDDDHAWVDVELEDLIYDASTAAASENNEDNAASQIQAYCDNNKLSYTLNKDSHDIQFNLIDIIADICSKLK